jgi:hypothetical protein
VHVGVLQSPGTVGAVGPYGLREERREHHGEDEVDARAATGGGVGSTLGGGAWGEGSWCRCGGLMLGSVGAGGGRRGDRVRVRVGEGVRVSDG